MAGISIIWGSDLWVCHLCGHEYCENRFNDSLQHYGLCHFCLTELDDTVAQLNFYHEVYKTKIPAYVRELQAIAQQFHIPERTLIRRASDRCFEDAQWKLKIYGLIFGISRLKKGVC